MKGPQMCYAMPCHAMPCCPCIRYSPGSAGPKPVVSQKWPARTGSVASRAPARGETVDGMDHGPRCIGQVGKWAGLHLGGELPFGTLRPTIATTAALA